MLLCHALATQSPVPDEGVAGTRSSTTRGRRRCRRGWRKRRRRGRRRRLNWRRGRKRIRCASATLAAYAPAMRCPVRAQAWPLATYARAVCSVAPACFRLSAYALAMHVRY
eukprot:3238655-Rhodomonas_salina.2